MYDRIKGIKEIFLPPYPKEASQEMINYLREIERNLRELSRRTYTDTESSFTEVGDIQEVIEVIQEEIEIIQEEEVRISNLENRVGAGGTARPETPYLYQMFFDSNLGKPIWWSGSNWVDSEGNIV